MESAVGESKQMSSRMAVEGRGIRASIYNSSSRERIRRIVDGIMSGILAVSAFVGVAALLTILARVFIQGAPALNPAFFLERPLPVGEVGGGVAPAIVGTLVMLGIASVIGLPVGIGSAIYLSEYGRGSFATAVRFTTDLLSGLPSIVVGVFVWALLVKHIVGSYSAIAGGVALSIIMIPIVARTTEEILRLVPNSLREASLALGVPEWKTILRVVLPASMGGIITGTVLSLARAGGETAPLLLTALGNQFFSLDLTAPMAALPLQIYTYAASPYEDWHIKAWGGSLVLVAVIAGLSLLARLVMRGRRLE